MNTILIYMFKSGLFLAAFYLIYFVFLSRDTMYARNRIYLLASVILSFILPFVTISLSRENTLAQIGKNILSIIPIQTADTAGPGLSYSSQQFSKILFTVYLTVFGILLLKLIYDLLYILNIIYSRYSGGRKVLFIDGLDSAGFTALDFILVNSSLKGEEAENIIRHEENHLGKKHYLDILFMGLIKPLLWFNPVIYLVDRSLRAVHEYQADRDLLAEGLPVTTYQSMLANQLFATRFFPLSNSFSNPSLIRKRFKMMVREKSRASCNLKLLLVLPLLFLVYPLVISYKHAEPWPALEAEKIEGNITMPAEVFVVVEEMPRYPGGETALLKYIYNNLNYPESARNNNVEGRVIMRFAVMANGYISNVSVLKGVSPEIDREAIRVIKTLPRWKPGKQRGFPVNVWYSVPVTFSLK
jgi:TonB family protein